MCEIGHQIPTQNRLTWRNFKLQKLWKHDNSTALEMGKTLSFRDMKAMSVLDHILWFWNFPISIELPAAKISGGTVEIYSQSHTKVSLRTLSHYVPTDSNEWNVE